MSQLLSKTVNVDCESNLQPQIDSNHHVPLYDHKINFIVHAASSTPKIPYQSIKSSQIRTPNAIPLASNMDLIDRSGFRHRLDSLDSYTTAASYSTVNSIDSTHSRSKHRNLVANDMEEDEEYNVIWVDDEEVDKCMVCNQGYTFIKRRHHCRSCGNVVCDECSTARKKVYGLKGLQRVCTECLQNGVYVDPTEYKQSRQMTPSPCKDEIMISEKTISEGSNSLRGFYREKIRQFYLKHAPHKVSRVNKLMNKYPNDFLGLYRAMHLKYNIPFKEDLIKKEIDELSLNNNGTIKTIIPCQKIQEIEKTNEKEHISIPLNIKEEKIILNHSNSTDEGILQPCCVGNPCTLL